MKPGDQIGDFYIPEGETRNLQFVADWFWFRTGTFVTLAIVDELKSEEPVLLRQYGADQLLLQLQAIAPDPSVWVKITRYEGSGWGVNEVEEPGGEVVQDASDAM